MQSVTASSMTSRDWSRVEQMAICKAPYSLYMAKRPIGDSRVAERSSDCHLDNSVS